MSCGRLARIPLDTLEKTGRKKPSQINTPLWRKTEKGNYTWLWVLGGFSFTKQACTLTERARKLKRTQRPPSTNLSGLKQPNIHSHAWYIEKCLTSQPRRVQCQEELRFCKETSNSWVSGRGPELQMKNHPPCPGGWENSSYDTQNDTQHPGLDHKSERPWP